MKKSGLAFAIVALALGACSKGGGDAPTGQVVATVDGVEITAADLKFEAGGMSSDNPAIQKQIQQAALQSIINRQLVANAAKEQKLDQTPVAAMALRKAEQMALVEIYQQKLREGVPKPSQEEATQYVNEHPSSFANRRIFVVDQVIAQSVPREVVQQMEPLDTLEQIQGLLDKSGVKWTRVVGTIDALQIDGDAAEKIAALPSGAVFVAPEGGGIRANRIRESQVQPVTGDNAIRLALEMLQNRRISAQLRQQMETVITAGKAKVSYNEAFKPAPPPAAPAAAKASE
jgi:EpsD family peptidyl-prolyl cis-trans isomerase